MTLSALLEILPVPPQPIETVDSSQWETYELITGISLPDDYKAYLQTFGTGIIAGTILPYNPFCARPLWQVRFSCRSWLKQALAIQEAKQRFGTHAFPYAIYPEPDGVLPWGRTENGDVLFWRTIGSPDRWHVLLNEARSSVFEEFACSMTDWVHGLLTSTITSAIIPPDALDRVHIFETI